jgi:hypothetical protein
MDWIKLAKYGVQLRAFENTVMIIWVPLKCVGLIPSELNNCQRLMEAILHKVT